VNDVNTKVSIIICPKCEGRGSEDIFNGDSYDKDECRFCGGKRVVKQITTVKYEKIDVD
jgi:DnaJ-class molecular chaperone